ncbi:hypothetical protein BaRGS_00017680, partial [Batillaria attramentaria]
AKLSSYVSEPFLILCSIAVEIRGEGLKERWRLCITWSELESARAVVTWPKTASSRRFIVHLGLSALSLAVSNFLSPISHSASRCNFFPNFRRKVFSHDHVSYTVWR